jgi:hypothetical protein
MSPVDDNWSDEQKAAYHQGAQEALERPKLTLADIRQMSTQEIMSRKREVDAVLRQPREQVNDDD